METRIRRGNNIVASAEREWHTERKRYCPIEHLARNSTLSDEWGVLLMAMLTACFDASGSEMGRPCLVVAGFVATATDWTEFSRQWTARLARDALPYFRMSEFSGTYSRHYDGWSETRRRDLLSDLIGLIQSFAYRKFGTCVVNQYLADGLSPDLKERFLLNAYPLGGRKCAGEIREWILREFRSSSYELIFEDGDLHKGKLLDRLCADGFPAPVFKPKITKDQSKPAFIPLQAADILAFEAYQAAKNIHEPSAINCERWPFIQLGKIPGELGIFSSKNIDELENMLSLSVRLLDWKKRLEIPKIN